MIYNLLPLHQNLFAALYPISAIFQISLTRIRVIIINVGIPVAYPPIAFVMAILFTFAGFPCTTYPEWVTFFILIRFPYSTPYLANIEELRFADSLFLDFHFFSGVLWVRSSVDVSKCDWLDTVDKLKSGSCPFEWKQFL